MPEIICVGPQIRDILRQHVGGPADAAVIDRIPECPVPNEIRLGISRRGRREKGEKRPPSAYQSFISTCMKSKHINGFGNAAPAMKECATAWKKQKGS